MRGGRPHTAFDTSTLYRLLVGVRERESGRGAAHPADRDTCTAHIPATCVRTRAQHAARLAHNPARARATPHTTEDRRDTHIEPPRQCCNSSQTHSARTQPSIITHAHGLRTQCHTLQRNADTRHARPSDGPRPLRLLRRARAAVPARLATGRGSCPPACVLAAAPLTYTTTHILPATRPTTHRRCRPPAARSRVPPRRAPHAPRTCLAAREGAHKA
jgi:hypothetical protein